MGNVNKLMTTCIWEGLHKGVWKNDMENSFLAQRLLVLILWRGVAGEVLILLCE